MKKISLFILFVTIHCFSQKNVSVTDSILSAYKNSHTLDISKVLDILGAYRYPDKSDQIIAILLQNATTNREKADCQYSLANYYFYNHKLDSASIAINKAENSVNANKSPLLLASIKTTKAGIVKKSGDVITGNRLHLEALEILENIDTTKLSKKAVFKTKGKKMVIYNSLAIFNIELKNFKLANDYLSKAIEMAKVMGEKATAGVLLNNQGDLLIKMGKYKEAVRVLEESEALKKASHLPQSFLLSTALNLATARYHLSKSDSILDNFNTIIKSIGKSKNKSLMPEVLLERGNIYKDKKDYKKAIADFEQAYKLVAKSNDLELQRRISKNLYQSFYATRNYKKAVDYQNIYTILKDSIFNDNNIKNLTQMEMQYKFDKKTALQKIKNQTALEHNRQIIRMLSFGLLSLFIILGLGFRLYSLKKKNNRLLEQKNGIIKRQLNDYEILLKETHHRVKNSLQLISSLLYLQSENIKDKKAADSVREGQMRVKSVALIHQKLYQKDCLTGIEISDYIKDLVLSIFQSHQIDNNRIELEMDLERMTLDIDTIIPIGIIINELVVNVIKHAFDDKNKQPKLGIQFKKKTNQLILKVIDNGKGFDLNNLSQNSFGIKLIKSLIRKLKATFEVSNINGTTNTIIINEFVLK